MRQYVNQTDSSALTCSDWSDGSAAHKSHVTTVSDALCYKEKQRNVCFCCRLNERGTKTRSLLAIFRYYLRREKDRSLPSDKQHENTSWLKNTTLDQKWVKTTRFECFFLDICLQWDICHGKTVITQQISNQLRSGFFYCWDEISTYHEYKA